MSSRQGLTLVEVIVAIALLAILGVSLVSVLPALSRNTRASSVDTIQSQQVLSIFERVAIDWTNQTAYDEERVNDGRSLETYVSDMTDSACTVLVEEPSPERKRAIVTCPGGDGLPDRSLRAEFGDPGE